MNNAEVSDNQTEVKNAVTKLTRKSTRRIKSKKSKRKPSRQEDRSAKIFRFIDNMIRFKPDIMEKSILSALKAKPLYSHYTEKGDKAENYARKDIRRIRNKILEGNYPKPPNEVEKMEYEEMSMSGRLLEMQQIVCAKMNIENSQRLNISASLLERLYLNGQKSILNFPCASGKTTAAIMLVATYASSNNRMWVVTQKIQDVCRIAQELRELGCNALEWHGRPSDCQVPREVFITKKGKYFCSNCKDECTAKHKYLSKDVWDNLDCDVLVTTHSHWQATVNNEKFSDNLSFVIVDESPTLMEHFSLNDDEVKRIRRIFHNNQILTRIFNTDIAYIRTRCDDGGCYRVPKFNTIRKKWEIIKCVHKLFADEKISSEDFELVKTFINFFSSTEIYAMLEYPNGKYKLSFIRGNVDIRTTVPHIVLDGSALMSDSLWEGFTIYECDDLKQAYPNTTLDVLNANPSKSFLSDRNNFQKLHEKIVQSIMNNTSVINDKSPIVIFQNKELKNDKDLKENIEQLEQELGTLNLNIIEMYRGEHIGSNKAKNAVLCAIAMSLFNNLSYYVLRTALVNHNDIPAKHIWKTVFRSPHMKSNGGFANPDIQQTYCRALVVDLYQTIMRGCVRINPEAEYHVICTVSGPDIIAILQNELMDANFHYEYSDIINALWAGESKIEIMRNYGIKKTKLNNLCKTLKLT
jgi:hypothetical protein